MDKRIVGINELSEYLAISKNTIYWWIALKRIPHMKLGKILRFDLSEIDSWVGEHKINVIR